ncbi:neural cell adhesion molecule L1-like protein [Pseudochaenichthys georgianus]|uniref:neural cell adhesion molecule L1-like protein n=1 Tax=Pseudochaenichthys georgianus TaxID=52239 RepID=UPI00146E5CA5|nr:neural cell adhesion molecule L1-like protein [Pseudochaenichthys georgianus]
MRLQKSPGLAAVLCLIVCMCAFSTAAFDIPLEVLGHVNIEQLPTITDQSPSSLIAFPFDESFPMMCEAKGNPEPEFRWTKNGQEFDPDLDPRLMKEENSGTFVIPNNGNLTEYQGNYRCYASNRLGTAISKEIEFIVPHVPKFPKETLDPVEVEEGQALVLECNPPQGIPPLQIYWMTINLQHIEQDERVSMGLNGDLYFSHAMEKDSRRDYCCFAAFPRIRTIVQKNAMSVIVKTKNMSPETANAILERRPSLLTPSGDTSETQLVKGEDLQLECIAEGLRFAPQEFIIEYEESQWEPGSWKELLRIPGNHNSAVAKLHGHVDYRFRVSGVNDVGRGRPSEPTERYKTPATAPDKNPENVRIEGHLPHEMDIHWEPLLPIQHNGPGLEYEIFYKRQGVEEDWQTHTVKRHSFVVKNTPTFVPYEIKIQARNNQGRAPEPKIVSGYSGEDFPSAAPKNVSVEVMNSSVVKVSWTRVHKDTLHGHLGGYRVNWWRMRSLADVKKNHGDKQTLAFPGDRNHGVLPGLAPFSEYSLIVMTFNGRGNGPGSHPHNFKTPEGVPEKNPVFGVTDVQKHTVSLAWAVPSEPNGILTGYLLEYQLVNETEEVGPLQTVNISNPDTNKWILRDLEPLSKYKLYLRSCTTMGCGPISSEECTTTLETTSTLASPVGISKSATPSPPSTRRSPATKPTRSTIGLASVHGGISTQGWFIGLMCAIALLTLIVLIACFVNRNKGGKYSVKEKEDLHPDVESQGMNDDTFCEYSDNDEKPLKGSQHSLSREIKAGDSGDSLVDYGDEDVQFNEDGSFIGEYAGRKEKRVSAEIKASAQTPA